MAELQHVPVLVAEVVESLNIKQDGLYIDVTFGRGGHSHEILKRLNNLGRLVALDRDPEAIANARKTFAHDDRVYVQQVDFENIDTDVAFIKGRKADGVVVDLGVSSPQLDDPARGFSFNHDGPLDMRMDFSQGVDAATWVNSAEESELVYVLRVLGEERYARRIARALVETRSVNEIQRTKQLADVVSEAVPTREFNKHPATRTFQAIRIYINRELEQLKKLLPKIVDLMAAGGRLVVISFHSLEDRIVKRFMREQVRADHYPPEVPVKAEQIRPRLKIIGKAIRPRTEEISRNPRARSAVMRVAERTAVA